MHDSIKKGDRVRIRYGTVKNATIGHEGTVGTVITVDEEDPHIPYQVGSPIDTHGYWYFSDQVEKIKEGSNVGTD